jgi:Phospholipase_D-nuclease N-terminal
VDAKLYLFAECTNDPLLHITNFMQKGNAMNISPFFDLLRTGLNGIAVFITIFWLYTLVDCLTKESSEGNDKLVWTLVIILVPLIGSLLYYFVRRPERIKAVGH